MHPLRISKEATSLDLFDAALGSLELLLRDAARLYEAARERA